MSVQTNRLQVSAWRGALINVLILAVLSLHGCSPMRATDSEITGEPAEATVGSTVGLSSVQYFTWLHSLTDEERHLEKIRLETAYKDNTVSALIEGVQLALLLSTVKPADTHNLLLALSVLRDVNNLQESADGSKVADGSNAADGSSPTDGSLSNDYAEFAQLWQAALLQHTALLTISQEQTEQIERLQERNLRLHNDNQLLREQNQLLLKENPLLQEEIFNLQLQIDALKEIEQQLNQREQLQEIP